MNALWTPQPGPQTYAATCPADEVMFGGTRGGGKSDCAIGRQIRGCEVWGSKWNGLMIRKKYKDFAEIRRRIDELIALGMPCTRTGGDQQTNYIRWENGAIITLAAIKELKQVDDYLGHQYTEITIDEAPSFPFIAQLIDKLQGCLRSPHGVPCRLFLTGNPGGPGANTIKMLYIKKAPPGVPFKSDTGKTAVFIPSSLADNKILCQSDPSYVNRLRSIKDPALRAAWLLGDWDAFIGQAFDFSADYHVVPVQPVPPHAPLYMTYDWGFGAPFSIGWWWVDGHGRLFRFAEWYGWDGATPNTGLRYEDSRVALGIKQREERLGIDSSRIIRLASHDCWNKKPDFQGGGQGPSTMETFANMGIFMVKADPSRHLKITQFRERLKVDFINLPEIAARLGHRRHEDATLGEVWMDKAGHFIDDRRIVEEAKAARMQLQWVPPMLQVYASCEHFIRTVPSLCVDENDVEDIDTDQEDHVYDDAAQVCMARPMAMAEAQKPKLASDARIDAVEQEFPADSHELAAYMDQREDQVFWESFNRQSRGYEQGDMTPCDGGRTYSDVDGR